MLRGIAWLECFAAGRVIVGLSFGEQEATGGFYTRKRHEFAFVLINILTIITAITVINRNHNFFVLGIS